MKVRFVMRDGSVQTVEMRQDEIHPTIMLPVRRETDMSFFADDAPSLGRRAFPETDVFDLCLPCMATYGSVHYERRGAGPFSPAGYEQ